MSNLQVKQISKNDTVFLFEVVAGKNLYKVTVPEGYYRNMTDGKIRPGESVKLSFEFLPEREPASAILSEFDLPVISRYFPEYEGEIRQKLQLFDA